MGKIHFCGNALLNFKLHFQGDQIMLQHFEIFSKKYKKRKILSHSNTVIDSNRKKTQDGGGMIFIKLIIFIKLFNILNKQNLLVILKKVFSIYIDPLF